MSEVKRYVTTCDCMSEASWGDYVRHADYDALAAECERLRGEMNVLYTTMMAAAVEIQEHWQAHCDEEGYGPANLMHRLERGIASQYGYDAKTLVQLEGQRDAALAELAALKGGREANWRDHSVNYAKGEKCPQTIETLQAAWDRDQELLFEQKQEISRLKEAINQLRQKKPAQASAWVPEGLTAITRSMGRAIVRFKTTEQLNAFYRSMKSAIAAPTPCDSDGKGSP